MPYPKGKRPLFGPEDLEAKALMDWVRLNTRHMPGLAMLRHISNEGRRNPAKAKAIGILAGIPDYILLVPAKGFHGWLGELKVPASPGRRAGTATKAQKDFIADSKALGYHAGIYWGWQPMAESLKEYLKGADDGRIRRVGS